MTLLSADELRKHLETDLEDPELERLEADAEAAIVSRFGANPDDQGLITLELCPGGPLLFLDRPVASQDDVDDLVETNGSTETNLDPTKWRILHGGYTLQRIGASWASSVRIVYAPAGDLARRRRMCLDLVHLAIEYKPVTSSSSGDVTESPVDYQAEREKILKELTGPMVG